MDFTVDFLGLHLQNPLLNGAGSCKTLEDVKRHARSAAGATMIGSYTVEERAGNPGNTYWSGPMYAQNALGMPNRGLPYLKKNLPEMARITHGSGKALFVSVAGFSPEEYAILTEAALEGGADFVEENMGCPNVWSGGLQHCISSFDLNTLFETAYRISKRVGDAARVGIKFSPYSNPSKLTRVVEALSALKIIKFFTSTNTFPNALLLDENGKPRITANGGFGSLSGPAMKPIGLGQVLQIHKVASHTPIIGVGGVARGQDVIDYLACGASLVQMTTAYLNHGEGIFSSILMEWVDELEKAGRLN